MVGYYTGVLELLVLTWGRIRPAPLDTIDSTNPGKTRWTDWSIWLQSTDGRRTLKAEVACSKGVAAWVAMIAMLYFAFRG